MSTASFRLADMPGIGIRIDRGRKLRFTFEGRGYDGLAGDTIASALAANGVRLLSRSFKYRRPRGILSMSGGDANALVQLPGEPNVPADLRPVEDGMEVRGQNYDGALARDRGAWIERFARFLPVGFYYKAFYRPRGAWRFWERRIRARAGLGAVDISAGRGVWDGTHEFCDVAVIGAGPAGLAAAAAAAAVGARVLLVDDRPAPGGALAHARDRGRLAALVDGLRGGPVLRMAGAACVGLYADNWLAVLGGRRLRRVRAGRVVLATGTVEQPAVFRNNDLPGVMLCDAARRLIRFYAVAPGRRAVVAAPGENGAAAAWDLIEAGIAVAALIDLGGAPPPPREAAALAARGVAIMAGRVVAEAVAGRGGLRAVRPARILGPGRFGPPETEIACDLICVSGGHVPAAQLACHAGARLVPDPEGSGFAVEGLPDGVLVAGAVRGTRGLASAIAEGRRAGRAAAAALGFGTGPEPPPPPDPAPARLWAAPIVPHREGREFVDFDEDLQIRDIVDAAAEGYDEIELLKRFSTLGMGPSQGRHSALAGLRIAACATGRGPREMGTTTTRPPVFGVPLGALAGRGFHPLRRTAMHDRHIEAGAEMMLAGAWARPAFYGVVAERGRAVAAEARNVREAVGLIDVSTLGGIEVRGTDAAAFLERIYVSAHRRQPVGRLRYALACGADGGIVDDGVACRFSDTHFYVTATTGGVEALWREMLWYNAQWRLDVDIANATAAWCGINIAGPRARAVLVPLVEGVDLAPAAFPYLGVRRGRVAGIPARLLRVGFVGELGYEIHAPAESGEALWDALAAAGASEGIRPFGVEAQRLLRLEKGHVVVGQDTDGLTTPAEAGLDWAVAAGKPFFVGGRALAIRGREPPRQRLAGFRLRDGQAPPPEEGCLAIRGGAIAGRVTSAMASPSLGRAIGLAFLPPADAVPGTRFEIRRADGTPAEAETASLPFYDPDNLRQAL